MTDSAASKPELGRFGSFGRGVKPEQAKDIEALGYGLVGGSPPAELARVEPILAATTALQLATSLSNYRNNWKRLGCSDEETAYPGSDRLIDTCPCKC